MRPLDPHPTPILLPCVRCYHRGACAWDGTAQAEECGPLYRVRGFVVRVLARWNGNGPRNVLVESEDGSRFVRQFRGLRRDAC